MKCFALMSAMWKLLPGRCSWALFKDRLRPLRFSIHSWYLRVFCFDGFPYVIAPVLPLLHFPLLLFQRPRMVHRENRVKAKRVYETVRNQPKDVHWDCSSVDPQNCKQKSTKFADVRMRKEKTLEIQSTINNFWRCIGSSEPQDAPPP